MAKYKSYDIFIVALIWEIQFRKCPLSSYEDRVNLHLLHKTKQIRCNTIHIQKYYTFFRKSEIVATIINIHYERLS